MDRKAPDEEEKKSPTKRNPLRVAITLSWSTHTHYKNSFDYDRDVNCMEIEAGPALAGVGPNARLRRGAPVSSAL